MILFVGRVRVKVQRRQSFSRPDNRRAPSLVSVVLPEKLVGPLCSSYRHRPRISMRLGVSVALIPLTFFTMTKLISLFEILKLNALL